MSGSYVQKESGPGFSGVVFFRDAMRHIFISAVQGTRDSFQTLAVKCLRFLSEQNAQVVAATVFAPAGAAVPVLETLNSLVPQLDWPISFVEGGDCGTEAVAGLQIHAVSGVDLHDIVVDGRCLGRWFNAPYSTQCFLAGIGPVAAAGHAAGENNAATMMDSIRRALKEAGMAPEHLVRAWFYDPDCLGLYQQLGSLGSAGGHEAVFSIAHPPAITVTGGADLLRGGPVAACFAIKPSENLKIRSVHCPLSGPEPAGVFHSRAVELCAPDYRQILLSGTMAIGNDGRVMYPEDANSQISLVMELLKAALHSRGFGMKDLSRGVVYASGQETREAFEEYCGAAGLQDLPVVFSRNTLCRPGLLFQMELDAIQKHGCQ